MTMDDVVVAGAPPGPVLITWARSAWASPLWVHVLVLCAALFAATWFVGLHGVITVDEGLYGTQARAVAEGSWDVGWRYSSVDPGADWYPLAGVEQGPNGVFPYARQPLFIVVLAAGWSLLGSNGLEAVPLLAVVLACVAAWAVAGWAGPTARRSAFWLCASSPVLVNGWILWGHALMTAVAGLGVAGALAWHRRGSERSSGWLAVAAVALAGVVAALLRSDGLVVAMALAGAVVAAQWSTRRLPSIVAGASVVGATAIAVVVQRMWVESITGGSRSLLTDRTGGESYLAGRLDGLWHSLLEPAFLPTRQSTTLIIMGVVAMVLAGWAGVRSAAGSRGDRGIVLIALLASALLTSGRAWISSNDLVSGFFPAWPVAAFVVGGLWRRRCPGPARVVLVFLGLLVVGVLASQYPDGGAIQWGGRFFSAAIVPLACLGGWQLGEGGASHRLGSGVRGAVAALAVSSVIVALVVVGSINRESRALIDEFRALDVATVVTDQSYLPKVAWEDDGTSWVLAERAELSQVAQTIRDATDGPVAVATARSVHVTLPGVDVTPSAFAASGGRVVLLDR